uniref:Nicotinamide phosphoribosyltransferase n=1 Tax=Noctiluca scintillans TaxID=2966 RepID=A0A7S1AAI1_NOCSC
MGAACQPPASRVRTETPSGRGWDAVVDGASSDLMCNIMLLSDSYKTSHWRQYPPNTTSVYSYFESRGGKFEEVTFFGLQYFLRRYLVGRVVTRAKIDAAEKIVNSHMGLGEMKHFNRAGWEHILKAHDGRLPIRIKAAPEGMSVPVKNVLMTVENTDPKCFWLTNYLETLLVQVWYPMTVCTQSRAQKKIVLDNHIKTGCGTGMVDIAYKLNDFGVRGVSSMESAALGGAAHLVNFAGSDNMPALILSTEYYDHELRKCMGTSIPAAEHSTITSWGKDGEVEAFRNMLTQYPEGLVAVVSDSYDIYNACTNLWGKELKDLIASREPPTGRLVVRPDSGDPPKIVVEVLELLGTAFGTTTNSKGFKLLPPYLRVIQGDGISYESMSTIYDSMLASKWAADNIVFGSGGALLQRMDRDTQKCAFKCCQVIVDGKARHVYKDPITDKGKMSKKGILKLVKQGGKITTLCEGQGDVSQDLLVTVFEDGQMVKEWSFDEVRVNSEEGLVAKCWS